MRLALLTLAIAMTLGGCGLKGPLYLPTPPEQRAKAPATPPGAQSDRQRHEQSSGVPDNND